MELKTSLKTRGSSSLGGGIWERGISGGRFLQAIIFEGERPKEGKNLAQKRKIVPVNINTVY